MWLYEGNPEIFEMFSFGKGIFRRVWSKTVICTNFKKNVMWFLKAFGDGWHPPPPMSLSLSLSRCMYVCVLIPIITSTGEPFRSVALTFPIAFYCLRRRTWRAAAQEREGPEEPEAAGLKLSPWPLQMLRWFPRLSESWYALKRHVLGPGALVYCHWTG